MLILPEIDKTLRPYQRRAIAWIKDNLDRAIYLRGDMGVGKTRIALVAVVSLISDPYKVGAVVAPLRVGDEWIKEAIKVYGTNPFIDLRGLTAKKRRMLLNSGYQTGGVFLLNYESLWRDPILSFFKERGLDFIIYDEVHKLKGPMSKVSKSARYDIRPAVRGLILGMSGTPTPNNPLDYWGQYAALNPNILGWRYTEFRARYAEFGRKKVKVWDKRKQKAVEKEVQFPIRFVNLNDLTNKISKITHYIEPTDLELPEIIEIEREFELDATQKARILDIEMGLVELLTTPMPKYELIKNAITRFIKMQQISNGFYIKEDGEIEELSIGKALLLLDILDEIGSHEPVVVFTKFRKDVDILATIFQDQEIPYSIVDGSRNQVTEWQTGKTRVLIANIQAASHGLNLMRARYAIFYALPTSWGVFEQAKKRVHRLGQTRGVRLIYLLAEGKNSIDRRLLKILRGKKNINDVILKLIKEEQDEYGSDQEISRAQNLEAGA